MAFLQYRKPYILAEDNYYALYMSYSRKKEAYI
jgi:hypothetical protein